MDQDLDKRLIALEAKIEKIYKSTEATRKMYLWSLIVGAVLFIVPLIGLGFVIPQYLKTLDVQTLLQ